MAYPAYPSIGTIKLTVNMPTRQWEFPRTPFVTYEAQDEGWCRKLGMGREVIKDAEFVLDGAQIRSFSVEPGDGQLVDGTVDFVCSGVSRV